MILGKHFYFLILLLIKWNFISFTFAFQQWVNIEDDNDMPGGNVIEDESSKNITYICGRNFTSNSVKCVLWFKDANVKPVDENFEIRTASFSMSNITTLKRDHILPDNEDTVEEMTFRSAGVKFIEDGAFDKFILLRHLRLQNNLLTDINEKVLTKQLGSTLNSLILSGNKFKVFNLMVLKNLNQLNALLLDSNPSLILSGIFPILKMKVLGMSFCGIKSLEEDVFMNLPKLEILMLEGNNISSIPSALKYLPNLYQIQLNENLLTTVESNAFVENPKLIDLFLHQNPLLLSVQDCAFCGLPVLNWLWLNSCPSLSNIHENAFGAISTGKAPSLDYFYVNECNLTVLPEKLLDWKNTKQINIGGNPFSCNCSMAWLFEDLLSESSIYDKKIKRRYHGHKYILGCFPPLDTVDKHFLKPLNISDILKPCKQIESSSFFSFWFFFLIVFGLIVASGIYAYFHQNNFKNFFDRLF